MLPEKKWSKERSIYIIAIYIVAIMMNGIMGIVLQHNVKDIIGIVTVGILLVSFIVFLLETNRIENGYRIEKYYNYKRIFWFFFIWSIYEILILLIPPYLRPILVIGILCTFILNTTVGFLMNIYFSTMLILIADGTVELYLLYILSGVIGCLVSEYLKDKKTFITAGISIICSNICLTILFEYLATSNFHVIYAWQAFGAGLIAIVLVKLMLPYVETYIDHGLYRRLWSICSSKHILLKQLKDFSESEYQHTLAVAKVAGNAAELIGADPLLAKVGGLYHRIGLVQGSDYIEENIKLTEEYNFPIELVQVLYEYSGRFVLPSTKEAAIVMIVDTMLMNFTKYRKEILEGSISKEILVQQTFNEILSKGLLDKSGITLKMYMDLKELFLTK
ncbi:HDIG domain-containing metalloprotein [Anaerosacchariphilus polymeriproducens]|uniref:HDIG domain-containing protein n=1 Tax=Anaerosacchariphilus polymeriproducens TaxID=1812858 RepID=A0A371AU32_9FIRM|nr:HDIG domain-containing metalloprotein [Anaerosacchariphilus polymeriproducens]RDU23076.1 HDIG domain-containing protein [Anaerosacchariphilus polymeriproducens]